MGKYADLYSDHMTKKDIAKKKEDIYREFNGEAQDHQETKDNDMGLMSASYEGIKNLPKSAYNQVKAIYDAAAHPVQTWEGLKVIAKDIYKDQMKVALKDIGFDPEKVKFEKGSLLENIEHTPALDFIIDDMKTTYGDYEGFKKTLASDPARIAVDIGTIAVPTAKLVGGVGVAAKLPKVAAVAEKTSKVASMLDPVTAALAGVKVGVGEVSKLTGKVLRGTKPTAMYKSAAKMSTTLDEAERTRLAQIALDNEIVPTLKGLAKIDEKIGKIDAKIAEMISAAAETGKKMKLDELFKDLNGLIEERRLSTTGLQDEKTISRIKQSIKNANEKIGRDKLTPEEAQKFKQTVYKDLSGYYESMKNSSASIQAQKLTARAAKEFLEDIIPDIKMLNKQDGDLLALREAIKRPVSRISNRDVFGQLGMVSKTGTGALIGHAIGGADSVALATSAGLILGVLDDPLVKTKLAIVLNKMQKKGLDINEKNAFVRLMLEESARSLEKDDKTVEE